MVYTWSLLFRAVQVASATALMLGVFGCGSPCDEDAIQCDDDQEFRIDPTCQLVGPLEVVLGQGEATFRPLLPLEEPVLYQGSQGLQHMWLGVGVGEPALDFPLLKVRISAAVSDPARCAPDENCDPWVGVANRELTLGPDLPLAADGSVEQSSLLLVYASWPLKFERRIRLHVTDACGREGEVEHLMMAH